MFKNDYQLERNDKFIKDLERANVSEFIIDYFFELSSSESRVNYWTTIRDYLIYSVGSTKNTSKEDFMNVNHIGLIKYFDYLLGQRNFKPSTFIVKKKQLSSFFSYLTKIGVITKNPIFDIPKSKYNFKLTKTKNRLPSNIQIDELRDNVAKIKNDVARIRINAIIELLLGSGIRKFELISLDLDDLHLDENNPSIDVLKKGHYHEFETEVVYLTSSATKALKIWIDHRINISSSSNAVFVSNKGNRIGLGMINKVLDRHKGEHGNITPHMLRHYYATYTSLMLNDDAFIQEQLGHAPGSSITNDFYISSTEETLDKLKLM